MKYNDKRKIFIRVVAIVLAALMGLGVFAVLFNTAFAASVTIPDEVVATGSDGLPKGPIIAAVAALIAIVLCVILPKLKKKD